MHPLDYLFATKCQHTLVIENLGHFAYFFVTALCSYVLLPLGLDRHVQAKPPDYGAMSRAD